MSLLTNTRVPPKEPKKRSWKRGTSALSHKIGSAGPVTIRRVDGTTTVRPAYDPAKLRKIV